MLIEQVKGKEIMITDFKNHDSLTWLDKLKITWYQRKRYKVDIYPYDKKKLRASMGAIIMEQVKSGKGKVKPRNFKLFPFLTIIDRLKIRWYQRKK